MSQKLRGAIPSPRHVLASASPFVPAHCLFALPNCFWVPKKVSMWGNDTYGDCVSAEEAAAIAAYDGAFVTDGTLEAWAKSHGVLNGAVISDVLQWRTTDSLTSDAGTAYLDGPASAVDWTAPATLNAAIVQGPIKIGVASSQLESAVNQTNDGNGWLLTGASQDENYDHCVSLFGYGTVSECYAALDITPPAAAQKILTAPAYLLFTWDSIGVIDQPSLVAICGEAWLRTPTTIPGPTPVPTPTPTPTPPSPAVVTLPDGTYTVASTANGVTFTPSTAPTTGTSVASLVANADGTGTLTLGTASLSLTAAELTAVQAIIADFTGAAGQLGSLTPAQIQAIIQLIATILPLLLSLFASHK